MEAFSGYHSEWNLGSPGGWDYQRMTQEIGRSCWEKIRVRSGLDLDLDFAHPLLNPMPGFLAMILRAHRLRHGNRKALVLVVAEEETLDAVVENRNLALALNATEGVHSEICAPQEVEYSRDRVRYRGEEVTTIFMDFNTDVLLRIHREQDLTGLIEAVRRGILVNPRGMEAINSKAIFEAVKGPLSGRLSRSTVERTPWTRAFRPRRTEAPDGSPVADLVEWTRSHRESLVLKPAHGYSGHGVFVGPLREDWDADVETALSQGDYIVQAFVPLEVWSEEQPWLEPEARKVVVRTWQTDFRCLVSDRGLIGFVARFGGVPTNVGSGGGVQPLAVLRSPLTVGEATRRINDAAAGLAYEVLEEIRDEMARSALAAGLVYLLGPIKTALRPRLILPQQIRALQHYSANLWEDCRILETVWREGGLGEILHDPEASEQIYRLQPWQGSPAVLASDGLFGFGAQV